MLGTVRWDKLIIESVNIISCYSSGSSCWYCSSPILQEYARCQIVHQDPLEVIDCIKSKQILPGCTSCICTLLCYWEPDGPQCKACLEREEVANLFVNNMDCPQGWTFSAQDAKCFKAHAKAKTWEKAKLSCSEEGSVLAEPFTFNSINKVLEALSIYGIRNQAWIGASREELEADFRWSESNRTVSSNNWAHEFPVETSVQSCGYQSAFDGFFRYLQSVCTKLSSIERQA